MGCMMITSLVSVNSVFSVSLNVLGGALRRSGPGTVTCWICVEVVNKSHRSRFHTLSNGYIKAKYCATIVESVSVTVTM